MQASKMRKRKCVICGKEFEPISNPQKTCSMKCRGIYYVQKGKKGQEHAGHKREFFYASEKARKRAVEVGKRMEKLNKMAQEARNHGKSLGKYKEELRKKGLLYV